MLRRTLGKNRRPNKGPQMTDDKLEVFKAEDFQFWVRTTQQLHGSRLEVSRMQMSLLAELANAKLAKLLGPRVYGEKSSEGYKWFSQVNVEDDTHTAYLFQVTEIKKECVHEPEWEIRSELNVLKLEVSLTPKRCRYCGVKLTAKWEVAE